MGRERQRYTELLERVLEISIEQAALLKDGRFVELLERQSERERLFGELKGLEASPLREDARIMELAGKIMENDSLLALNAESEMGEIKARIGHLKKGAKALKAYSLS